MKTFFSSKTIVNPNVWPLSKKKAAVGLSETLRKFFFWKEFAVKQWSGED